MSFQTKLLCAVAVSAFAALVATAPAQALTRQECSAKYKEAKANGTLNGQKWNAFRKANCGKQAAAAPATAPAATTAAPAAPTVAPAARTRTKSHAATAAAPAAPSGPAVFPTAISPKYAKEKPGTARMHTCVDQYRANKATNSNGGLRWIQKGGGYYSQCNKRLKGA